MSVIFSICSECKHEIYLEDTKEFVCPAFPKGIPAEVMFRKNPDKNEVCNNNIKFEKSE